MLEGRLSFQGDTQFGGMHSFLGETNCKETYYYVFVCANGVLAERSRHISTLHKKGHQDLKGGADIFQKRLRSQKRAPERILRNLWSRILNIYVFIEVSTAPDYNC